MKSSFGVTPIRLGLYGALLLFSFILFCISAARLHYTDNLSHDDSLNGGRHYYDPIVVELLVSALLTMGWSIFVLVTLLKRLEFPVITTFLGEIAVLSVLWLFWIVGAADSSSIWGDLSFCQGFQPCQVLSAMLAFAWLGWITLTVLLVLAVLFCIANKAWNEPLHGRWDPRMSTFSGGMRESRV
ncbi:hypothetical protein AGABI2DRAFT_210144 [Agaricus bisporus var. bisporus H97]|uniref:hypothetical protein n=1 Tax=Agaricus bisporus var. bisporus (strain H97 / ATCC MYA-4626 / FGSC 10389) TaxID=936046 RepID=UPI00029F65DE|nr:hypothetical protein AGABI2DRAFT_210144 [Agaricus bisporus var. bisporus H97]EKV43445.1 hypothetical protein AGABI2DRAFT_210144 [Agaricus bisporus var. bisporus H97]